MFRIKIASVLSIVLIFLFPSLGIVQTETTPSLTVTESAIATGIQNLTPIGEAASFPSSIGNLYAFSKITGATKDTSIKHLWYYGDKLMAGVSLDVKSISWRTYSSKKIIRIWTGKWRVDITTEDGTVLETLNFTIQ